MRFQEYNENSAAEFFNMLKDAPKMQEILTEYPGVEDLIHAMTSQIAMHFILPYMENRLSPEDLVESIRRYLLTSLALGITLHRCDMATDFVMDLYNKGDYSGEEGDVV